MFLISAGVKDAGTHTPEAWSYSAGVSLHKKKIMEVRESRMTEIL